MLKTVARICAVGVAAFALVATAAPAGADSHYNIRTVRGTEKVEFLKAADLGARAKCWTVAAARSDARWVMAWPSFKCGPSSGHGQVYFRTRSGQWKYMFYDMDTSRCHRVPASVRRDFTTDFMC